MSFELTGQGRTSFEVVYRLEGPEGQLFATAKTVMVALDAKTGSPRAIPPETADKLFA